MKIQTVKHVLEIQINGFYQKGIISSDGNRSVLRQQILRTDMTKKDVIDYTFIALRDTPFRRGEVFKLHYWPLNADGTGEIGRPNVLEIKIVDEQSSMRLIYSPEIDEKSGNLVLKPLAN